MRDWLTNLMGIFDSLSVSAFAVIIGGVVWLTEIHLTTSHAASALAEVQRDVQALKERTVADKSQLQVELLERLQTIDNRLSRIEGRLH